MSTKSIPTFEELTPEFFTQMLRGSGDLAGDRSVTSAEIQGFGAGTGITSRVARALLTYDGPTEAPTSLVLKAPTLDEHMLFISLSAKFYEREVRFYRELADDVPVTVSRCLYADIEPDTSHFLIVLDDIGHQRQVDQIDGCGWDDALAAVDALADLHAHFWGKDLAHLEDSFLPMNGELNLFVIPMLFGEAWPKVRERFGDLMPAEVHAIGDRFVEYAPTMLNEMQEPNTLAHFDFRIDNVFFGDGSDVTILDFQLAAVTNGTVDISYFVSQSLRTDIAAARGAELLDHWLGRLTERGVAFDRDLAWRKYRNGLIFGLMFPINMLAGYDTMPERGRTLAFTMLERSVAAIMQARSYELVA